MRAVACLGSVIILLVTSVSLALAQVVGAASDAEQQYDAAFQEMLRKPADLEVLFKFATVAGQTGDLEGAVSALERMLLIDPNLPRVRLELGVLYYRMGSFEMSRTYLDSALKSPSLPSDVRSKAEQFLAEIEKRMSPSQFSGEVFLGFRYQSNANLGPSTSSVRLFGDVANLNQSATGQSDWGVVSSTVFRHTYDLGLQDKSVMETQLTAYANRQFQIAAANVSILDLTTGPRFQAFQGIFEDVSIKPFFTGGYIWVNDTPFYGAFGAGLEAGVLLSDRLRNTSLFVWRRQIHPNTWYIPTNNQFDGVEYSGNTTFSFQLNNLVMLFANGATQRFETDQTPWQNYQLWGIGGGMAFRFADPLFKSELPWTITLSLNQQWWLYDAPDVTVDPTMVRQQMDTILNLVLAVPFDDRTTFSVSGGRFSRAANIVNYEFVNNSIMFGVNWRFSADLRNWLSSLGGL